MLHLEPSPAEPDVTAALLTALKLAEIYVPRGTHLHDLVLSAIARANGAQK